MRESSSTPKITNIVHANLFSRFFACLLDCAMVAFAAGGLYLGASAISTNTESVKKYLDVYVEKINSSGLMEYKEKGHSFTPIDKNNFDGYCDQIYTFYNDFYSKEKNDGIVRDKYWFNIYVMGQEDVLHKYDEKSPKVESYISTFGKEIFTYKLDETSQPIVDEFAIPKAYENGAKNFDTIEKDERIKIKEYFFKDDETRANIDSKELWSNFVYYYALSDLTGLDSVSSSYQHYAFYGSTLPLYISIVFSLLLFLFVVPLCFKNGETFGKLIMHVCLVNKNGYQYKRTQLLLRTLPTIALCVLLQFLLGLSFITLSIISFIMLASYICAIFTKNHSAFHDYIAGTIVIDKKNSTWFLNADEEGKAQDEVKNFHPELNEEEVAE